MTVDETLYRATESFVLPTPRTFYPAYIPVQHWQLRSLVSNPTSDILYYPSDKKIYSLDTSNRTRQLITTLPFSAECLAAKYGWVCCGGAKYGQFAAVKLPGTLNEERQGRSTEVDALLPLELTDPWRSRASSTREERSGIRSPARPEVHVEELGGSIVNSVTIYRPRDSEDGRSVVAVITNNDQTVRIFSLSEFTLLTTLEFDIPMNHASVSPDGEYLVAVGDGQDVYFHKPYGSIDLSEDPRHRWKLLSDPPPRAGTDALFSTAFSPSSQYCAVASQDGTVTIFDTRRLDQSSHDDSVVRSITSSRPGKYAGAVRSVSFSPDPWDLLMWTEHDGRICVLDSRDGFQSRQLIDLVAEVDTLERVEVLPSDESPRRRSDDVDSASSRFPSWLQFRQAELAAQRETVVVDRDFDSFLRVSSSLSDDMGLADDPTPTWQGTHTLAVAPQNGSSYEQRPISINYLPPPSARRMRDYMRARERTLELGGFGGNRSLGDIASTSRTTANRNSNASGLRNNSESHSQPQPDPRAEASDPWQTIEAAMASGRLLREREFGFETSFSRRREGWTRGDAIRRERLSAIHAEEERLGHTDHRTREEYPEHGTTGCSFSGDGRILYVGTERGIIEYHINIPERKYHPQITHR